MSVPEFREYAAEELALAEKVFWPSEGDTDIYELLGYLNGRTTHRFTGVYRFEPGWVISVALFDREQPAERVGADVKMKESYCWLTGLGDTYKIEDALLDRRLADHAAREAVRSYVAVLLRDRHRAPWGTLCHFDFAPRTLPADTLAALVTLRPLVEEMFVRDVRAHWDPDASSLQRFAPADMIGILASAPATSAAPQA